MQQGVERRLQGCKHPAHLSREVLRQFAASGGFQSGRDGLHCFGGTCHAAGLEGVASFASGGHCRGVHLLWRGASDAGM